MIILKFIFVILVFRVQILAAEYTYETSNSNNYMCPKNTTVNQSIITCAQGDVESTTSQVQQYSILNCGTGIIKCFLYGSIGKVGGSCAGDPFYDDPKTTLGAGFVYLPDKVANEAVGKSSYQLNLSQDKINGEALGLKDNKLVPKIKVLALCGDNAGSSQGLLPSTSKSCFTRLSIFSILMLFLIIL